MQSEIESTVIKAIAAQKQMDEALIGVDSSLEELGISSLDAITIIYEIEDRFGVEVPNDALEGLSNVQDIVNGIGKLLANKD